MFSNKKKSLFNSDKSVKNSFIEKGLKLTALTKSENNAIKYSSTDNEFINQFSNAGAYKEPRKFTDIAKDQSTLFGIDKETSIKFILYLRTITRTCNYLDGTKTSTTQRGAGVRHEAIMRMIWLGVFHKESFQKNLHLFVTVGSWKDIIQMLSYDLQYNGWEERKLDWNFIGQFLLAALENPNTNNLVKKYLPQIKSNKACKTIEAQADNMISKWICSLLFKSKDSGDYSTYQKYRKLKTSGTAHEWQQLISQGKMLQIDFNTIHGRALAQLVSGKFITNNKLETRYEQWISTKPVAKYTGYPHELFAGSINTMKPFQISTLNAQFKQLVEVAKKDASTNTGMIVTRDTSGSMGSLAIGTKQSCYDIAKALALFFSEMLPDGHFADSWIEFNSDAKMHKWNGSTPYEKWNNDRSSYVGGTDFQSVIELFIRIKQSGVKESDFPSGIICISDSEFNSSGLETNYQQALRKLSNHFSKEYVDNFKVVLWNLQRRGGGNKYETYECSTPNVFYFGGYDGSIIAFLTGTTASEKGTPRNATELFEVAMEQEVLNMIQV